MKKFKLRDYQERSLAEVKELFKTNKEVVLAMCPGGGKTATALKLAEQTNGKVLVLAHGTTVIKRQWKQRIKDYEIKKKDIKITLPQSAHSRDLEEVELLIIDEAHEFYTAKMVKSIIKRVKPKRILLLTGTPSKFVLKKYPMSVVAAEELLDSGVFKDVYFSNVGSSDELIESDFNKDGDVFKSFKNKYVEKDMDNVLKAIVSRLKESVTKNKPYLSRTSQWVPVFGQLHKTMFACNNIDQAKLVNKYLLSKGVNSVLSNSKNDVDSAQMKEFVEDKDIKVLIVVRRGILGFDFDELVNVIDMTLSKNPDRVYQLMARVMRSHEDHDMKYFFKLAPQNHLRVSEFFLRAALSLLNKEFMSEYNGKNLDKLRMPAIVKKGKKRVSKGGKKKGTGSVVIDPNLIERVESLVQLTQLFNKEDTTFNEKSYITLGEIKRQFSPKDGGTKGLLRSIVNITKENLAWMIKHGEVDERIYD